MKTRIWIRLKPCSKNARFGEEAIAQLNVVGDTKPATWNAGEVTTSPGFKQTFRQYAEGGWQGLQHAPEFGGQGLPKTMGAACLGIFNSSNLSFGCARC
ncbi:probable acyl-CoA dehydrogenase fragment [Bordetella petrii]|uniref:Probable acyl-CoA dehydrogenase n=1 Tax=Bordetella petrii (strain ATCC BAA-461 / DSM 12804 / CCUG 43448 / CIP 107267 / Se-1111R) TaxID=340100 RepID=A9I373_BORPD|nr:probable acyl-CoA dehydrogenase fragment [Bordetella petrii]